MKFSICRIAITIHRPARGPFREINYQAAFQQRNVPPPDSAAIIVIYERRTVY